MEQVEKYKFKYHFKRFAAISKILRRMQRIYKKNLRFKEKTSSRKLLPKANPSNKEPLVQKCLPLKLLLIGIRFYNQLKLSINIEKILTLKLENTLMNKNSLIQILRSHIMKENYQQLQTGLMTNQQKIVRNQLKFQYHKYLQFHFNQQGQRANLQVILVMNLNIFHQQKLICNIKNIKELEKIKVKFMTRIQKTKIIPEMIHHKKQEVNRKKKGLAQYMQKIFQDPLRLHMLQLNVEEAIKIFPNNNLFIKVYPKQNLITRMMKNQRSRSNSNERTFKPQDKVLRMFENHPSLISEQPITPRKLNKLITLPRLYDQHIWKPNNFHIE